MTDTATEKELRELRAQVDELLRAQGMEKGDHHEKSKSDSERGAGDNADKAAAVDTGPPDDAGPYQLQELVDALEDELKETNPLTVLVVFAIGILIGRLLPR